MNVSLFMTVTKNLALALKMLLTYRKYCPPTSIIMGAKNPSHRFLL